MDHQTESESPTPTLHSDSHESQSVKSANMDFEKGIPFEPSSTEGQDAAVLAGPDPAAFPDGGFQAWFCIAGGFCTIFCGFGWINCIGVFQDYYQANQLSSYTPSEIAWIPATESFMLFFFGLVSGRAADNYGPRWPLLIGSFMHVFGLMMISISDKYYQFFLAQSVCSGIGCSFLFYPAVAAAGTWFKKHRALAFGIMLSGSSIGGVILPIMVQRLIVEVGFGWSMRITAFLILALLVIGNIAVKSRLPPVRKPMLVKEYFLPFVEIPYLLLVIGSILLYFGAFLPFNFIIVEAQASGMSASLAGYLIPILNGASTVGRILPAHLGDRYGVLNVCIVFTIFSGVISLALWLPAASNGPLVAFAVLYGFASGLTLSIIPAVVASISDVQKLGFRVGALYAVCAFGVLFGNPIAGAIVTSQGGSYSGLKIFCGVTLLAGGVFFLFSRIRLAGLGLTVKV